MPETLSAIRLIAREKDVVVRTSNDELSFLSFLNLKSQSKLNFVYSLPFNVINCSNFVNTCNVPNVCNDICLQSNSSLIQNEKKITNLNLYIYQTINIPSANVVTIVNIPS